MPVNSQIQGRCLSMFLVAGLLAPACLGNGGAAVDDVSLAAQATAEQCYVVSDVMNETGADVLFLVNKDGSAPILTQIGTTVGVNINNIESIAVDPFSAGKTLYAANADRLGTLDVTTGVFTAIGPRFGTGTGSAGPILIDDVDGLSFDPKTGTLYGSVRRPTQLDLLIVIDKTTGTFVPKAFGNDDYVVIESALGNQDIDDIAIDTDGTMYAIANNGGSGDHLVVIDKTTGKINDKGATNINDVEGLGFDTSGQLWGSAGSLQQLYKIDKATGAASNAVPLMLGTFTDYESIDCFTGKWPPDVTNPDGGSGGGDGGGGGNGNGDGDDISVTGGGCAAGLHGAPETGLILFLALFVTGLVRRRRRS